ncbi:hypothetical protein NtRootA4_25680 [Arthrobacter sp. NtRootA4]|nr:hypothetical protein NtRootA2_27860 [Arthrobacter sp. NtRootA2]BCW15589.1 hypothetical protein NtRootA4_25680 [Arthrobacter sp. NtRootA4]BCW23923.1 hypothetical protein NtRootC7_27900 [Arthrobacter sp. NtRootC7]BCW28191.1 hypothetical protein NtRootC45_27910 [Arthrobacter sp. NtRootC45]BCW32461.1 hypothetical protein NtRootD5_27920 [Arthrobacter sp. NtRootD5]
MHLIQHIIDAVDRYWTVDVEIIGIWKDGPAACVVHRRTIDPTTILGHRFEFTPASADGTIEGYARDIAINLAEPIGTLAATARQDEHGIVWVVIPKDRATPEPPAEILEKLGDR